MKATHRRRTLMAWTALISAAFVLAPAATATAEPVTDNLVISHDGQTFAPTSDVALFTDMGRIVPGDEAVKRIWFRNIAAEAGLLQLHLVDVTANSRDLARATALVVANADGRALGGLTLADATDAGDCAALASDISVDAGATIYVDVTVSIDAALGSMPGDDGRDGTHASVGFRLRAALADARVGPGDAPSCPPQNGPDSGDQPDPDDGHGDGPADDRGLDNERGKDAGLGTTGTEFTPHALVLMLVLISSGLAAIILPRRRKASDDSPS